MLSMGSSTSGRDRERDELWKKSMTAIGIRIEFIKQKWPDLLKMGRAGKLQMWPVGWITTYGEGDAFMQLLYSTNIGQSNYARFVNAEYDELYRQSKRIPDGPERNAIYRKMAAHRRRLQPVGPRRLPATRTRWCGRGCRATRRTSTSSTRGMFLDVDLARRRRRR